MIHIDLLQKRLLKELNDEEPYSSKTLGNLLGVSDRTVRSEINKLNEILKDHGAEIITKARFGCKLSVSDREAYMKFREALHLNNDYTVVFPEHMQLAHALVRTVVCSEKPVHLNDLTEVFYTNITALKNAVSEARGFLREYHLTITNGRNGLQVLGREHDIRILLVNEYSFVKISDQMDVENERFMQLYDFDQKQVDQIMDIVIEIQQEFDPKNYNLSPYSIEYISRLVLISIERQTSGHILEYDSRTVVNLSEYRSYLAARRLIIRCSEIFGYPVDDMHMILFTMCFAGFRNILTYAEETTKNYLVCRRFAIELIDYISDVNHFELFKNDNALINNITFYLMSYTMRADYGIITSQFAVDQFREIPPMTQKLSMQAFFYLYREYQLPYNMEEIIRLASIFHPALGRNRLEIIELNACVISRVDMRVASGTAERLKRNFGSTLQRVDVLELYHLKNTDLSKYDVMFTTYSEEFLKQYTDQPLPPLYHIGLFFHTIDKNRLYSFLTSIINYKSNPHGLFHYLDQKNLYYGVRAANEQDCLRLLCEYLENDIDNAQQLQSELEIVEYTMPSSAANNVVIVSGLVPHAESTMISIMVLEKPILWGYKVNKAQIIVYWDQGRNDTMSSLFEFGYLPNFIQSVCHKQDVIDALIAREPCEKINQLIANYQSITF